MCELCVMSRMSDVLCDYNVTVRERAPSELHKTERVSYICTSLCVSEGQR